MQNTVWRCQFCMNVAPFKGHKWGLNAFFWNAEIRPAKEHSKLFGFHQVYWLSLDLRRKLIFTESPHLSALRDGSFSSKGGGRYIPKALPLSKLVCCNTCVSDIIVCSHGNIHDGILPAHYWIDKAQNLQFLILILSNPIWSNINLPIQTPCSPNLGACN